jgi:2-dehydropantoate 2-reductase
LKICIYGAGAIGGYIGVMLKRAGADVSLVARGSHLEAIKQNGLKLQIKGEELSAEMPASSNPADLGPQDYVIIALKAHQAWEVAREMAPLLGPNTAVVTAQNGLPWWYFYGIEGQYANRRIESVDPGGRQWDAIGPERIIGCTVYPATEVIAPGVVKHIDGDKFGLGEPNRARTERTEKLSQLFSSAGLKAPIACRASHLNAAGPGARPAARARRDAHLGAGTGASR